MSIQELYVELMKKYEVGGIRASDVFIELSNGQIMVCLDKMVYRHYVDDKCRGYDIENERLIQEVQDYVEDKYPGEFYMDVYHGMLGIEKDPDAKTPVHESRTRWMRIR